MKRILSLVLALCLLTALIPPVKAVTFSDTSGHWAEKEIERWSQYGILKGGADGRFDPNAPVTKAQLAAILNRLLHYPNSSGENPYADLRESDWYYQDVMAVSAHHIIHDNGDGLLKANEPLSREEAVYMLGRAFGLRLIRSNYKYFPDAEDVSDYALPYLNCAGMAGLISGYSDGKFHPKDTLTRAQIMKLIDNFIDIYITEPGDYTITHQENILVTCAGVTLNFAPESSALLKKTSRVFISPAVREKGAVAFPDRASHAEIYVVGDSKDVVDGRSLSMTFWSLSDSASDFAGGDGTPDNPYLIANEEQFKKIAILRTDYRCYRLIDDIELSGVWNSFDGAAVDFTQEYAFTGYLDGNGHCIRGMNIETRSAKTTSYYGLFRSVSGIVKNLTLDGRINLYIPPLEITENDLKKGSVPALCAGGIAGMVTGEGRIENCVSNVNVSIGGFNLCAAGGIAGVSYGRIADCRSTGKIEAASGGVSGYKNEGSRAGGIVGLAQNSSPGPRSFYQSRIINCSSASTVAASSGYTADAGGIIGGASKKETATGDVWALVEKCFFNGSVTAENSQVQNNAGGIAGRGTGVTISQCWAAAKVHSSGQPEVFNAAGGIAGAAYQSTISDCWANAGGVPSGDLVAGGIAGRLSDSVISNSFVTRAEGLRKDALCNGAWNNGTVNSCYDFTKSGYAPSDWNFNEIWEMNGVLPVLRFMEKKAQSDQQ